MWGSRSDERGPGVTCIACGEEIPRSKAREYDKYGDRWDRDGKEFEYVCKPCDRDLCHQPRGDLEALLVAIERETEGLSREQFLAQYAARTEQESVEER